MSDTGQHVVRTHIQIFSRFVALLSFKPAVTKRVGEDVVSTLDPDEMSKSKIHFLSLYQVIGIVPGV